MSSLLTAYKKVCSFSSLPFVLSKFKMQKAKQYNIADSNIANLGSDLEKKVKLEAAQHEEAWKVAGKEAGIQIWRIEQFKIVPVPTNTYGQFYSGDSYIVLYTYKSKVGDKEVFNWDVHFWLGDFTTQDEAGTAAYKTVELDDYLGGSPVQYREVQAHESARFLSHFPHGLRILEGGKETGFKHVEAAQYRTRLLHIKGKKLIRVHEVPLSHASLNSGDVFIVDAGKEIISWNGSKAGVLEKAKGAEISQAIEAEREGHAFNRVVDEGAEDAEFWHHIGGKGPVASAAEGGSDLEESKKAEVEKILFRLSDASGQLTFTEVGRGHHVNKSLLDSSDVFVLDSGVEVYAWVGKNASTGEKRKALSFAQDYVTQHGKPITTTVVRILEGGENEVWESLINTV